MDMVLNILSINGESVFDLLEGRVDKGKIKSEIKSKQNILPSASFE